MASTFLRKQNIIPKCRHYISTNGPKYTNKHVTKYVGQNQQQHCCYSSRFSNLFRKSAKDLNVPAPCVLPSPVAVNAYSGFKARVFSGFGWYLAMITSRPLITKAVTSSIIYAAADITSQTIALPSSEPYDLIRTLRMAGYGLIMSGPTLHCWFNFMSRVLPGRDLLSTTKKMILGQTVYGPIMTVVFFSSNAALQGENAKEIVARLRRDFLPTMLNCVIYWPLCDFITFRFAPVHLQPLVSNGFSFVWTIYMTYMASLEKASET